MACTVVIFDNDGTLLDTEPAYLEVCSIVNLEAATCTALRAMSLLDTTSQPSSRANEHILWGAYGW
jgi:beta-phosphoglucomutase-like phosphatase (HAD superfamily)